VDRRRPFFSFPDSLLLLRRAGVVPASLPSVTSSVRLDLRLLHLVLVELRVLVALRVLRDDDPSGPTLDALLSRLPGPRE